MRFEVRRQGEFGAEGFHRFIDGKARLIGGNLEEDTTRFAVVDGLEVGAIDDRADLQGVIKEDLARGHLRGVIRMVEEDAYCIDVIRQIQAIDAALNKVSSRILEDHLNSCVITAIQGNDKKERERVLKEITEVFEMSMKV